MIIKNYIDIKAKVDSELFIIPLLFCLPTFVFTFAAGDMNSLGVLLFFFILFGVFLVKLFYSYKYTIDKSKRLLIIKSMFRRRSIPIGNIKSIVKTNSLLAAPAPSLDRLSIVMKSGASVVISPLDKKGFISSILALNESIEV